MYSQRNRNYSWTYRSLKDNGARPAPWQSVLLFGKSGQQVNTQAYQGPDRRPMGAIARWMGRGVGWENSPLWEPLGYFVIPPLYLFESINNPDPAHGYMIFVSVHQDDGPANGLYMARVHYSDENRFTWRSFSRAVYYRSLHHRSAQVASMPVFSEVPSGRVTHWLRLPSAETNPSIFGTCSSPEN